MRTKKVSRCDSKAICHLCGNESKRHSKRSRLLLDVNAKVELTYSMHLCRICKRAFVNPAAYDLVCRRQVHTMDFIDKAIEIHIEGRTCLEESCGRIKRELGHSVAPSTLHDWLTTHDALDWRRARNGTL